MILLLDVGNSRLKWAMQVGERLQHHGSCLHQDRLADMTVIWGELPRPDAVYCASVASAHLSSELTQQVKLLWDLPLQMLQTSSRCVGVSNGYRQPEKLGVDRWAALIAAHQLTGAPLCVVDCGSAVTVDVLDGTGNHLGGWIMPGLHLQQTLLRQGTAAIEDKGAGSAEGIWGRDTGECMSHGSLEALAGLIERARYELSQSQNEDIIVFITGGDAGAVIPLLGFEACHEEHLVLQGVAIMAREQGE